MSVTVAECAQWTRRELLAMGTTAVVIAGDPPNGAVDWALDTLEVLEQTWSRFRPDSELSDLNASNGRWFPMSSLLRLAVDRAAVLHTITSGLFDPTVLGCLTSLGYDRSFRDVAADGPVPMTMPAVGFASVVREDDWILVPDGVTLDLGGIGKGLAADLIAVGLIERGAASACVSLGGDIRIAGAAPEGGWRIPVEDPRGNRPLGHVPLTGGAIVASTTRFRRWTRAGRDYHHIVDPTTGDSARRGVIASVVIDSESWRAEGIAKAAIIAGRVDGPALIERCGATGWMFDDDGGCVMTGGTYPVVPGT